MDGLNGSEVSQSFIEQRVRSEGGNDDKPARYASLAMQQAAPAFDSAVLNKLKSSFEMAHDALVCGVAHRQVQGEAIGSLQRRAE